MTPDGRQGWADLFRMRDHTIYTTDWPGHGRNGYILADQIHYEFVAEAVAELVRRIGDLRLIGFTYSMSGPVGWKLLEIVRASVAMIVAIAPGSPRNVQSIPRKPRESSHNVAIAGEVIEDAEHLIHIRFHDNNIVLGFTKPAADIGEYIQKLGIGKSSRFPMNAIKVWKPS